MKTKLLALSALALRLLAKLPFLVHVIEPNGELFPHRGLLLVTNFGATRVDTFHLVLGWRGSARMYWARLTFHTHDLFQWRDVWGTYMTYPEAPDWMEYERYGKIGREFGWPWQAKRWEFGAGHCNARTGECLVTERWAEIDSL